MSQYSETIGSFVRTGDYPLEANYIFNSKQELIDFYNDELNKTTLHKGLFKIVQEGDKQVLYWVVADENGELVFEPFISSSSGDLSQLLDENGRILSTYLPSYVDDVLEYSNNSGFPTEGESGKIYVALDTNKIYRWSGTQYIEISKSLALGLTAETAFPGSRGKTLEDWYIRNSSNINLLDQSLDDKILKSQNGSGWKSRFEGGDTLGRLVFAAEGKSGRTSYDIPIGFAKYNASTTPTTYNAGLMSGQDKEKLDSIKDVFQITAGKGWVRIAKFVSDAQHYSKVISVRNMFNYEPTRSILLYVSGQLRDQSNSVTIQQIGGMPLSTFTKARIVYNPSSEGEQYVEIYHNTKNENAIYVQADPEKGMSIYTTATYGDTIPEGYTTKEIDLVNGIVTNDIIVDNIKFKNSEGTYNGTIGSNTTPIYLKNGIPTEMDYTIAKSVPANAVFTDTTYNIFNGMSPGLVPPSGMINPDNTVNDGYYLNSAGRWSKPSVTSSSSNETLTMLSNNEVLLNTSENGESFEFISTANDVKLHTSATQYNSENGNWEYSVYDNIIPNASSTQAGIINSGQFRQLFSTGGVVEVNDKMRWVGDMGSDTVIRSPDLCVVPDETTVTLKLPLQDTHSEQTIDDPNYQYVIPAATTIEAGVMSASDKAKLDGLSGNGISYKAQPPMVIQNNTISLAISSSSSNNSNSTLLTDSSTSPVHIGVIIYNNELKPSSIVYTYDGIRTPNENALNLVQEKGLAKVLKDYAKSTDIQIPNIDEADLTNLDYAWKENQTYKIYDTEDYLLDNTKYVYIGTLKSHYKSYFLGETLLYQELITFTPDRIASLNGIERSPYGRYTRYYRYAVKAMSGGHPAIYNKWVPDLGISNNDLIINDDAPTSEYNGLHKDNNQYILQLQDYSGLESYTQFRFISNFDTDNGGSIQIRDYDVQGKNWTKWRNILIPPANATNVIPYINSSGSLEWVNPTNVIQ